MRKARQHTLRAAKVPQAGRNDLHLVRVIGCDSALLFCAGEATAYAAPAVRRNLPLVTACTALPPHFLFERAVTSCGGFAFLSYRDECERVEVERRFSLAKRKCGMGLVTAKLRETAAHVIAMSVLVLNLRKIQRALLQLRTVFQLCACHPHTSNMTVAERFATFRYYCLMHVYAQGGLTVPEEANARLWRASASSGNRGPAGLRGLIIRLPTLRSLGIVRRFGRVSVPFTNEQCRTQERKVKNRKSPYLEVIGSLQ